MDYPQGSVKVREKRSITHRDDKTYRSKHSGENILFIFQLDPQHDGRPKCKENGMNYNWPCLQKIPIEYGQLKAGSVRAAPAIISHCL